MRKQFTRNQYKYIISGVSIAKMIPSKTQLFATTSLKYRNIP